MSGTKLHSLKAPATDALIVAHGQPSGPEPAEAALAELTARVQAHLPKMQLGSATLANADRFERMLETLRPDALVYPLFMANGWFVRTALRRRIGDTRCQVLTPLGLDPNLPALATEMITTALTERSLEPEKTQILLAAHGSAHGQAAAQSAHAFARRLSDQQDYARVSTGFVEQAPFLADLSREINAPSLCLPFFAMDGDHMKQDVRKGLETAGFAGDILPAIGKNESVPRLIAAALQEEHSKKAAA